MKSRIPFMLALGIVLSIPLTGCQPDDGVSQSEKEQAQRLDVIAKDSGGDWEKLSEKDRQYLITEIAHGKESDARMILLAKSGKLGRGPGAGGPQPGGPHMGGPGGPPPAAKP